MTKGSNGWSAPFVLVREALVRAMPRSVLVVVRRSQDRPVHRRG